MIAKPFLGEIRMFGGNYAPRRWARCNGRSLLISNHQSLYNLIGKKFGGETGTFRLPDLRGRIPIHNSDQHLLGSRGGKEREALTPAELATHTHPLKGSSSPVNQASPTNGFPGSASLATYRDSDSNRTAMDQNAMSEAGGSGFHSNLQPFLSVNFIIAMRGVYPDPSVNQLTSGEPILGEIRIFSYGQLPAGWVACNGQLYASHLEPDLLNVLGYTYGGNGSTTFALPDLRGRAAMHAGKGPRLSNRDLGESGGREMVTLNQQDLPAHRHFLIASSDAATSSDPSQKLYADPGTDDLYRESGTGVTMDPRVVGVGGGSEPHNNMQPFMPLQFAISMEGEYAPPPGP